MRTAFILIGTNQCVSIIFVKAYILARIRIEINGWNRFLILDEIEDTIIEYILYHYMIKNGTNEKTSTYTIQFMF